MDRLKTISSPNVPVGQCMIKIGDKIAYLGRIGLPVIPYLIDGAEMYLNPYDFKDGQDFMRRFEG